MTRLLFLFVAIFMISTFGCDDSDTSEVQTSSTKVKAITHPAAEVANQVLAAIHNGDVNAIKSFFNDTNRNNIGDEQFAELFEIARDMAGDVRTVSELRHGTLLDVILAKIRVVGEEVYVLVLEQENGQYRLEDINSPLVVDYEKMTLVN